LYHNEFNNFLVKLHIQVSQGSAATNVRWGGRYNTTFISSISENTTVKELLQELSYRQQIARQLRTQYAEGIYRQKYYTVTLKSRLRVTQGHWKRNHW